jgi:MFS family permease
LDEFFLFYSMVKNFFATPNHRTLALLFAASFIELTGYFMLSPLLTLNLHGRGVVQGVIGALASMSWLAILVSAPYAATVVARLGSQNTLRLCAVLPLMSVCTYMVTRSVLAWFVVAFVGSLASSLRWICSEATVAQLATDTTRGRWVSGYSTLIGLTFIMGPAGVSLLIAQFGVAHAAPWYLSAGLIAAGAALTFAMRLPAAQQQTEPAPPAPLAQLWRTASSMPLAVVAGVMGGFFEVGLNGVLPLYGIALGMSASSAPLLVSVSAVGGITGVLLAGWAGQALSQQRLIRLRVGLLVLAGAVQWLLVSQPAMVWGVVFAWGAGGAALYILVMVALGAQYQGVELVQRMAVLVMAYTLGGLCAPLLGGWALQWGVNAFHGLTISTALLGLAFLLWLKAQPVKRNP